MGYRPQAKSSRSGRRYQKTQHDKAKRKQKSPTVYGNFKDEGSTSPVEETIEKTLKRLQVIGTQKFALSPFSQYFDDWRINLREILSVFESNPAINVDDVFIADQSRILATIEAELAQKRLEEAKHVEKMNIRAEKNHQLLKTDADYAEQTREIQKKRNSEIENLTRSIDELEQELEDNRRMKTSFFDMSAKKTKAKKEAEINEKITAAKKELEMTTQNFTVEQEKLHDEYQRNKQKITEEVQTLEKEIEKLETDSSQEPRQRACETLIEAIKDFLERRKQTR